MQHSIKSFAGDETYTEGEGEPLPDVDDLVAKGDAELIDWDLQPGNNLQCLLLFAFYGIYITLIDGILMRGHSIKSSN